MNGRARRPVGALTPCIAARAAASPRTSTSRSSRQASASQRSSRLAPAAPAPAARAAAGARGPLRGVRGAARQRGVAKEVTAVTRPCIVERWKPPLHTVGRAVGGKLGGGRRGGDGSEPQGTLQVEPTSSAAAYHALPARAARQGRAEWRPGEAGLAPAPRDERTLRIVLHEGRNRQIRRMCEALGYEVRALMRSGIGALAIGDLGRGEVRPRPAPRRRCPSGCGHGTITGVF